MVAACAAMAGAVHPAVVAHTGWPGLPCPLRTLTGVPCPFCGMTEAALTVARRPVVPPGAGQETASLLRWRSSGPT
jgi:hypothetical protein